MPVGGWLVPNRSFNARPTGIFFHEKKLAEILHAVQIWGTDKHGN